MFVRRVLPARLRPSGARIRRIAGDGRELASSSVLRDLPRSVLDRSTSALRHYLHGDYLEAADRRPGNVVYCGFCDGFCLPEHIHDEHELAHNLVRLKATKKMFYRTRQQARRPVDAPNYLDGTPDPVLAVSR